MAKPALVDIAAGIEGWDAEVNDNMAILRDNPMPVKEYASASALPSASANDRCQAFKEHATLGWRKAFSDGANWRYVSENVSLAVNATQVGNVGSGEDDLMVLALAASTLHTNFQRLEVKAWGSIANNANAKTLKLKLGATTIMTVSLPTGAADTWYAEAIIIRTGASAEQVIARLFTTGTGGMQHMEASTPAVALGSAQDLKFTGEATADNDIVQEAMTVQLVA